MLSISAAMANILATNIRTLRLSRGEDQTKFGEALDVSQGMVSRWEKKGAEPSHEPLVKMAQMAKVSVEAFLTTLWTPQNRAEPTGPVARSSGLFLQVLMPSAAALTAMFEGLLEAVSEAEPGEAAQTLAQLLPGALEETALREQRSPQALPPTDGEPARSRPKAVRAP